MKTNPPPAADAPALARFAQIGLVPGQDFDAGKLNADFAKRIPQLGFDRIMLQFKINKDVQHTNGWNFTNTISAGSTITPTATTGVVNGVNGVASVALTIPAGSTPTLTVAEALRAGYTFVGAQCFVGGAPVTTTLNGTELSTNSQAI